MKPFLRKIQSVHVCTCVHVCACACMLVNMLCSQRPEEDVRFPNLFILCLIPLRQSLSSNPELVWFLLPLPSSVLGYQGMWPHSAFYGVLGSELVFKFAKQALLLTEPSLQPTSLSSSLNTKPNHIIFKKSNLTLRLK